MAGGTINLAVKTTNDNSGLKAASADLDALGRSAATAGSGVEDFDKKQAAAAKNLSDGLVKASALASVGILAIGGMAIKTAADFEHSMSQVAAVSGATGAELTKLKDLGKDIGADTAFSARDAAAAMEELAAGGRSVTQILGGEARAAVDLAAAGNYGLADSGKTIATVMDVWKNTQISTNDVVNRLAGAANASRFGVDDMSQAIAQAGGVAAQMEVSFEDFSTAIAMSASSFASGSDAGTSYKTFLLGLDGSTDKAKDKIAELNLQFRDQSGALKGTADIAQELSDKVGILGEAEQVAALKVIFGNDAYRTAASMMDGAGEAATRVNDILSNTNAADIAATRMNNAKGAFEEFKGSAETLAISLGEKALPAMTGAADAGVAMLNGFAGLPESTQGLALAGAALAISAPAAAAGISKLASMASLLSTGAGRAQIGVGGLAVGVTALAVGVDLLLTKTTGAGLIDRVFGDVGRAEAQARAIREIDMALDGLAMSADPVEMLMKQLAADAEIFGIEAVAAGNNVNMFANYIGGSDARLFGFNVGLSDGVDKFKLYEERVRATGEAMLTAGASTTELYRASQALPPELKRIFDETVGLEEKTAALGDAAWDASEAFINGAAPAFTAVADTAPPATTALDDFRAGLEEGAKWADELGARLDILAGRFGSLDPQMAINNINLAILKDELADVTRAGGDYSERLGMTTGQMKDQIKAIEDSSAAMAENEDAYGTLMGEMEKLSGPAGMVSGAVLNIDDAIQTTIGSSEDQIEAMGEVGQAMGALATGDIPTVVAALMTIGEKSPEAMKAFVDGITDPAKKEAIISHIETIAPAVGATLRPAMKTAGEEGGAALGEGAVTTIAGWGDAVFTAGEGLGNSAGDGMAAGIRAKVDDVATEAWNMVRAALGSAAAAQESRSPALKYLRLGRWAGEGYALGLKESEPLVGKAASEMVGAGAKGATDANGYFWGDNFIWDGTNLGTKTGTGSPPPGLTSAGPKPAKPTASNPGIYDPVRLGTAPPPGPAKLPLVSVGNNVYWDPNTETFVNGATNMPGTDATWNPATGELGTDAIQANGGLTVYQGSDGKWRRLLSDELATNADGTWRTERDRLDAIAYQSRAQAVKGPWITGGIHTIGGSEDGTSRGGTMGVTGAYMAGYMGILQDQAIAARMRQNTLGHGAISDRFYNYGQDMSIHDFSKSYGSTGLDAPGIDPWHPNAMVGGGTRYWQSKPGSAEGGEWAVASRRSSSGGEKTVIVNVNAMDSQSFLRYAPQIREALRQDDKRGGG